MELQVKDTAIGDLIPFVNNARTHSDEQIAEIAASIKEFGFTNPILIDGENGIIAGHGRLLAARKLGMDAVPCIELSHLSETQKRAYILADNRLAEKAGWDFDLISLELTGLLEDDFDINLTGFDADFILPDTADGLTDPDAVPDVPETPVSKLGDVWLMGNHRLMCGDSTSIDAVETLMDGQKADLCLTDPPYNIDYKYNSYKDDKSYSDYKEFCTSFFNAIKANSVNQIITIGKQNMPMWCEIEHPKSHGIWYAKNKMSGDKISNLALTEPIFFYGDFDRNSRPNDFYAYNVRQQKNIGGHTCPKVVEFFEDLIKSYSIQSVLDVFCGSGTAVIASEKLNRRCYGLELDPIYCDVIITRWQNYTGKTATLESTGDAFAEAA